MTINWWQENHITKIVNLTGEIAGLEQELETQSNWTTRQNIIRDISTKTVQLDTSLASMRWSNERNMSLTQIADMWNTNKR